jgi:hypothetical protein
MTPGMATASRWHELGGSSPLTPGVLRSHRRHSAKIDWLLAVD